MSHIQHNLGKIKAEYPVLEITEHNHTAEDDDHDGEFEVRGAPQAYRHFEVEFNGFTLLHLSEAYRALGVWLDEQYTLEAGEPTA